MTTQSIPPQGATHRNVLGNGWAKFIGGKQYSWTEIAGWVDVSVAGGFKLEFMQAMVRIPDALRFDESKTVAQSDAKPVAWIKPDVLATLRGDECCYAFGEQSPKGNLVPLFTRSDAGEIDRLNTVVEQQKNLIASLRAELTESYSIDEGDHDGRQLEWERSENKQLRIDLELTRLARQSDQIEIDGLKVLCDGFRAQLADAAQSLETISLQAGRDEFMKDMTQIRGYANSRARVAQGALSASAEPNKSGAGEVKL